MTGQRPAWVLGVDSGGSGLRITLAEVRGHTVRPHGQPRVGKPVRTGPGGIDAGHLLEQVLPAARQLRREAGAGTDIVAACVGAAGMATLGGQLRAELPGALASGLGVRRVALAADAVTGYAGALGERPGVVVAAGTGMIALGTDLSQWRRADGWGHLLGDCGSGAWIGQAGLGAAVRAHDGRPGGSTALLASAEAMFGPISQLPRAVYPRTDRAAALASFAPEVARSATEGAGDPVAARILRDAAREIAATTVAAFPSSESGDIALTGGLFRMGEPLLAPLRTELAQRLPQGRVVPANGEPLDGALLIAARLAEGRLRLPADPTLLHLG